MLNLQALFRSMGFSEEDSAYYASRHTELCGELAVMHALGVSLEEGFARFVGLGEEFAAILANSNRGSFDFELVAFIDAFSDHGWRNTNMTFNDAEQIGNYISTGGTVIALVDLDTASGSIIADGNSAHWIHIINVKGDIIEIFDPYTNSQYSMSTSVFEESWASPTGCSPYQVVTSIRN